MCDVIKAKRLPSITYQIRRSPIKLSITSVSPVTGVAWRSAPTFVTLRGAWRTSLRPLSSLPSDCRSFASFLCRGFYTPGSTVPCTGTFCGLLMWLCGAPFVVGCASRLTLRPDSCTLLFVTAVWASPT